MLLLTQFHNVAKAPLCDPEDPAPDYRPCPIFRSKRRIQSLVNTTPPSNRLNRRRKNHSQTLPRCSAGQRQRALGLKYRVPHLRATDIIIYLTMAETSKRRSRWQRTRARKQLSSMIDERTW